MESYPLDLPRELPICEKVGRLQSFLGDHYFHRSGMMYCMWHYHDGEARPFREETDLGEGRLDFLDRHGITHQGWVDGENSASTSGVFLWSQALRYRVTGDKQALSYAQRAFRSLTTIFAMGAERDKPGFIGKPWGWEPSTGTSPDQYICVMHGLWAYREVCSREDRLEVERMVPLMADWWRTRGYSLDYFGVDWHILPHHAPAMACLHDMAYRATGHRPYLDECRRLLTVAESWPTWIDRNRQEMIHPVGWPPEKNGVRWPKACEGMEYEASRRPYLLQMFEVGEVWLTMSCADYFMRQDTELSPLIRHAIARHYRYCQFGLREDLLTLMTIQVDLERDTWHPIRKAVGRGTLQHGTDINEVCWGDFAGRLADAGVISHCHAPDYCPGALRLSRRMLERLDNERLHWYIDPDGQQVEPAKAWTLDLLSSDVPSFTLLAYWRARAAGIDLGCECRTR